MNHSALADKAKADFDRDGFAVIRRFFSPQETRELLDALDRYVKEVLPTLPPKAAFYEDKARPETLFRLEQMQRHDPFFEALQRRPALVSLAGRLLDDEPVAQQVEMFGKALRGGKPTPAHQDGYYFMLEPNVALTFWLPIDRADHENGCIRYVTGSHLRGMRPHGRSQVFGFSQGIMDFGPHDEKIEQAICADPGDLIVHHSMTIHRTDGNPSDRRRRALGMVYYARRARQDPEQVKAYQQKLHAEWQAQGKL